MTRRFALLAMALSLAATTGGPVRAAERPPPVTWEWYNAAEAYLAYRRPEPKTAARYFRRAAEAGNAAAAFKLGELLLAGAGGPPDETAAVRWLGRAAGAGNPHAQVKLGECLQKGRGGLAPDPVAALALYRAAAAQGEPYGFHMLGMLLADGEAGVPRDEAEARRLLERSLPETNDPWAKWRLARLVRATDPARARRLFAEAAEAGNIEAWIELGDFDASER